MEPKDYCSIITGQNECFLLLLLLLLLLLFQTIGYLEGKLPVSNCRFLICQLKVLNPCSQESFNSN